MGKDTVYCDVCKHYPEARRSGHCMELKSTTVQEPNSAVFSPKYSCKGFVHSANSEDTEKCPARHAEQGHPSASWPGVPF